MKHFLSCKDIADPLAWAKEAINIKASPYAQNTLGQGKMIGLVFFNNSLRTRLSTQRAAHHLGLGCMVLNVGSDGWALELEDGAIMNSDKAEHIKEAAQVMSQYCDIIAVRAFAKLQDRAADQAESVLQGFVKYGNVPVVNLESSTGHPLQALADLITLQEHGITPQSKIVLSWAPHPKALPHAVANSFISMAKMLDCSLTITHPQGYELDESITAGVNFNYDQKEACKEADFVYVKNWSSYRDYGAVNCTDQSWQMTPETLGDAKFMHCLPVRRNVVVSDDVLDSDQSLVIQQANNRIWSAQLVLSKILANG